MDTSLRPEGSTEKADLAVACVLAQRPSSATEATSILASWPPDKFVGDWKHPRSTVYNTLERFTRERLLEKKRLGRSVIYSFREPRTALDMIWRRYTARYWKKYQAPQRRGPRPERADRRKFGIERRHYPGIGYELATNIITKNERKKLAAEIADPKYEPRLYELLCGKMVTTELENRACALLRRQSKKRKHPLPRRRSGSVLRPYIDWKGNIDIGSALGPTRPY